MMLLLWVPAKMARLLGGAVVEGMCGFRARQTQCSGNIDSEATAYLGMALRLTCSGAVITLVILEPSLFAVARNVALVALVVVRMGLRPGLRPALPMSRQPWRLIVA